MKKKGRALTAVLLGLTMVMSLAGCGQKKESTADTAAAGSEAAKTEESVGEKSTSAEMETITLKLGFNGDFLTMPEAVLGAAENLNKKYEQEGKNIGSSLRRIIRPLTTVNTITTSCLHIRVGTHRISSSVTPMWPDS